MDEIKDTYRSKTLEEKFALYLIDHSSIYPSEAETLAKYLAEIAREHYSHFIE